MFCSPAGAPVDEVRGKKRAAAGDERPDHGGTRDERVRPRRARPESEPFRGGSGANQRASLIRGRPAMKVAERSSVTPEGRPTHGRR